MAQASFVAGSAGVLAWLLLFALISEEVHTGAGPASPELNWLGLSIFVGLLINLVGVLLAVAALVRGHRVAPLAVAGLLMNGLELLFVLVMAMAGLIAQIK